MDRRIRRWLCFSVAVLGGVLVARSPALGQTQAGVLEGTIADTQGGVLPGADVRLSSPTPMGGPAMVVTDAQGQFRFLAVAPGVYTLDVELRGFAPVHDQNIRIGAGATLSRTVVLMVAGSAESIV